MSKKIKIIEIPASLDTSYNSDFWTLVCSDAFSKLRSGIGDRLTDTEISYLRDEFEKLCVLKEKNEDYENAFAVEEDQPLSLEVMFKASYNLCKRAFDSVYEAPHIDYTEDMVFEFEDRCSGLHKYVVKRYDDHIVLIRYLSKEYDEVQIPKEIEGKPVTEIGDYCFYGCRNIRHIHFPSSIIKIGAYAFCVCENMEELILPDSIMEIGSCAFHDCSSLRFVVMPKHLKRLRAGLFAFCYVNRYCEIRLPEELEVIESGTFSDSGFYEISIPDSVKEIQVGALSRGPLVTNRPHDKGWYLRWPYGESVIVNGESGIITDLHGMEKSCELHEITTATGVIKAFYPCDYIDGIVSFVDEDNKNKFERNVEEYKKADRGERHIYKDKLSDAYKLRDAWKKGLTDPS